MSMMHINGWVNVTQPTGPEGPVDPNWGVSPPAHVGGGPIVRPPHVGNKPPGRPILPAHPDNGLPPGGGTEPPHIWGGGHWEPVDPGFGMPPLWAFFPADPGFGIPEAPPPTIGGGPAPTPPGHITGGPVLPPHINGGPIRLPGGIWIPTDPDYGKPVRPCPPAGGRPHPPLWGFIPNPPDLAAPKAGETGTGKAAGVNQPLSDRPPAP